MKILLSIVSFISGVLSIFVFVTGYQKIDDIINSNEYVKEKRMEITQILNKENVPIAFEVFNKDKLYTSLTLNKDLYIYRNNTYEVNRIEIGSRINIYIKNSKSLFKVPYKLKSECQLIVTDYKIRKYSLNKFDKDDQGFYIGEVQISGSMKYKSRDYICFIFGRVSYRTSKIETQYFGVGYLFNDTDNNAGLVNALPLKFNNGKPSSDLIFKTVNYDNSYFTGYFKNNDWEYGIYQFLNGGQYRGQFSNNDFEGYGVYSYSNESKYIGTHLNDKRHGYGIYIINDYDQIISNCEHSIYYVGQWKNGEKNGQGTCYSRFGVLMYKGLFVNNKPIEKYPNYNGDGQFKRIKYTNDNEYDGEVLNGERNGYGVYYWSDGNCWFGKWKNNKKNGEGAFINKNGEVTVGKWENDENVYTQF